jgi:hypothetical protein
MLRNLLVQNKIRAALASRQRHMHTMMFHALARKNLKLIQFKDIAMTVVGIESGQSKP